MPLKGSLENRIRELYADNLKKGKAKGANGKVRSRAQIVAIAMASMGKKKK